MRARALVLDGYGLNCGYETDFAFKKAGADSERVHINELLTREKRLDDYDIMALIGGFSWGDDHGAGVLEAAKLKYNIGDDITKFIEDGKLIIGICNGFQALVNMGLLPALDGNYDEIGVALSYNDCGNFRDAWVYLSISEGSRCVFTKDIDHLFLPIRHAEGKFLPKDEGIVPRLWESNQIVLQYVDQFYDFNPALRFNPNGSVANIAGICDPTGRIFGLMPHPECHIANHQNPFWTRLKLNPHEEAEGLKVFRNAVEYVEGNL